MQIDFQQLAREAVARIPKRFRKRLENVAITTAPHPTREQLIKSRVPLGVTLLGLYEGTPQIRRSFEVRLPDKITIFEGPIRAAARNDEELGEIIYETIWHEIAHHFGTEEDRVRAIEVRRRRIRYAPH